MQSGVDSIHSLADLLHCRICDLGQPFFNGMPAYPGDFPFSLNLYRYHEHTGDFYTTSNPGFAHSQEIVITSMHVGTHIDALCHMSKNGMLYGGVRAADVEYHTGFRKMGIEEAGIIFLRGVLVDVAGFVKMDHLPPKYEITADVIESALESQSTHLSEGDAILLRTGYSKFFTSDASYYCTNYPGVGIEGAKWLAGKHPKLVGADNLAFGTPAAKVHEIFIVQNGIYMLKNVILDELALNKIYTFALVVCPLKTIGATGSLARPVAMMPGK